MKNRIYVVLLAILNSSLIFSQFNPIPYEQFYFQDYSPKWIHPIIDTSIIGHFMLNGPDTLYYDGWSHISSLLIAKDLIFNDSSLVMTHVSQRNYFEGAYIQKIDINTGNIIWDYHYDLRNSDRREVPYFTYLDKDNDIRVLGVRQLYHESSSLPKPFWLRATISERKFNWTTGKLLNHFYGDEYDSLCSIVALPLSYGSNNNYIFPSDTIYQHIKQSYSLQDKKLEYYYSLLDSNSYVISDTVIYEDYKYNLNYTKLKKLNNGNFIGVWHSFKDEDSRTDSFQLKISLYTNDFFKINDFSLENTIPSAFNYYLDYVDNNYFIIKGIYRNINNKNEAFYSLFDYSGNLMETVFLRNKDNIPLLTAKTKALKLKYEDGILIFTRGKTDDGFWTLNIYKSNGNGSLIELKILKVIPDNHQLDPFFIYQLENSDILLNCVDWNHDYSNILRQPIAQVWVYFTAEDLKLKTSNNNFPKIQSENFKIYPNPATDILTIKFTSDFNGTIEIIDILGRKIKTYRFVNSHQQKVDVSDLVSGLYYIKALDKSQKTVFNSKSFIVVNK